MSTSNINPAVLSAVHRAALRAGLKESVLPSDIETAVEASGAYFEESSGRLVGADSVVKTLRRDRPTFFKDANDLSEAEFRREMRNRGVRAR